MHVATCATSRRGRKRNVKTHVVIGRVRIPRRRGLHILKAPIVNVGDIGNAREQFILCREYLGIVDGAKPKGDDLPIALNEYVRVALIAVV